MRSSKKETGALMQMIGKTSMTPSIVVKVLKEADPSFLLFGVKLY